VFKKVFRSKLRTNEEPYEGKKKLEQVKRFGSFDEWCNFKEENQFIKTPDYIDSLIEYIRLHGFECPFSKEHVAPDKIRIGAPNYREGLVYKGLNSRLRAVLSEFQRSIACRNPVDLRIYSPEAVTEFALLLRGRYARFVGSEYSDNAEVLKDLFPIRIENLLDLTFPDAIFDAVLINDVFEHVADIDCCLRELARVTKSRGRLITTFPFNLGGEESIIKARLNESVIQYLSDPEYHGNPVDSKGSLVFEIPGWDILSRTRKAGWSEAEIVYETSVKYGIVGSGFAGIFTMVAVR
jgi:hypothetical protein